MSASFEFRRPPDLSADELLPADNPELARLVPDEIAARGPMTFARFMALVLYNPEHGYYATEAPRAGRSGDFLTAPEAHPIFGWAIARQLDEVWRRLGLPDRFVLREHGAGSGALGEAMLDGLRHEGSGLAERIRYLPVETSTERREAIEARLSGAGFGNLLERSWDGTIVGAVLANELLDALPTHRVEGWLDGSLREVFVGLDGNGELADVVGTPSTPALAQRLEAEGITLAAGQRAEVCLALDDWVSGAAADLDRGLLLLIDYGYPAVKLYDAEHRPDGTLRAYVRHRVHADPYRHLGQQDLTAHVDLTAVVRAAAAAGLTPLGSTTQAEFLAGLDAGQLLAAFEAEAGTDLQASLEARAALGRMLDPAVTGRFRVLAFGRDLAPEPPLRGFAFRLRR